MTELPIYELEGKWYFRDEEYRNHGPYGTEAAALVALYKYVLWLETGEAGDDASAS